MTSWSGSRVGWALLSLVVWALVDTMTARLMAVLPSTIPVPVGYAFWLVLTMAAAWFFVVGLRLTGAPTAVWLGVLGWSVIRLVAVVLAFLSIGQVAASPSAGLATAMSVIRTLAAPAIAYGASRASVGARSAVAG